MFNYFKEYTAFCKSFILANAEGDMSKIARIKDLQKAVYSLK